MRTWLRVLVTTVLCALLIDCAQRAALAAERPAPLPDIFMTRLFEIAEEVKGGAKPLPGYRQKLSLAGRDDLVIDQLYSPTLRPKCAPLVRNGQIVDPISEIKDRARASRLVIVNEGHDDAQTRAFIHSLLKPLHELGFSVYAAETFVRTVVGADGPRWPRISDGFYSVEPTFGEVIRHARSLGFTFVPYESEQPADPSADVYARIAAREAAQSQNIMDRIVRPMPNAKALVHVGHHHVAEAPIKGRNGVESEWMASRLKRASGTDPLTIDQTEFQSPVGGPVLCALTSQSGNVLTTDLTVALPAPTLRRSRPAWRYAGGRVDVDVPAAVRAVGIWSIVEARYDDEPADAVPADRLLIGPDENLPFVLAAGKYRVEAWTRESGWTAPVELVVKARR